jgi:ribosomal protein S18 acetylase RimI-like enzyme
VRLSIEAVERVSPDLVDAVKRLVPQLSESAPTPTLDTVRAIVESDCTTLIVAKEHDQIVGILMLVLFQLPTGLRARLEDLVIDEPVRGKGVAVAMMKEGMRMAQEAKVRTIDYTARPSRTAANPFYDKLETLGFRRRDTNVYRYSP